MNTNKKHLYASFIFFLILIGVLLFIYFTSAEFAYKGEIVLPGEIEIQDIEYENRHIISNIEVNIDNYKDVITALKRPREYTARIVNKLNAYDITNEDTSYITVKNDKLKVVNDVRETFVVQEMVYITEGSKTSAFLLESFLIRWL